MELLQEPQSEVKPDPEVAPKETEVTEAYKPYAEREALVKAYPDNYWKKCDTNDPKSWFCAKLYKDENCQGETFVLKADYSAEPAVGHHDLEDEHWDDGTTLDDENNFKSLYIPKGCKMLLEDSNLFGCWDQYAYPLEDENEKGSCQTIKESACFYNSIDEVTLECDGSETT